MTWDSTPGDWSRMDYDPYHAERPRLIACGCEACAADAEPETDACPPDCEECAMERDEQRR